MFCSGGESNRKTLAAGCSNQAAVVDSLQPSTVLKDEEAERREREFPDRPGEECSEVLANDFIWVSVRLEVVFLFLDRS